jgi:hypothetical protein
MLLWLPSKPREVRIWDYLARKRRILRRILQHSNIPATIGDIVDVLKALGGDKIEGKHAVSWRNPLPRGVWPNPSNERIPAGIAAGRIWVKKFEAGAFDEDARAADLLQEYEAKIAAL